MKKKNLKELGAVLMASFALTLMGSCSEENFDPGLTRTLTIESVANGGKYEIKIALPENYNSSNEKYSTIYVLDGDENFDFVANKCKEISGREAVQNAIVIGIGYGNDRSIDYTPTKAGSNTGGGAQFLAFIKSELLPKVEQEFRVDTARSSRVILGHSYGGLFGACVLAVDNDLFGNYILLSPSIWFDNEVALQLEKENRTNNKDRNQLVFLGIGELENSGRMQAPFEALYQILQSDYSNIRLSKNREPNLDHVGSKKPNIVKGLNYYFQNR